MEPTVAPLTPLRRAGYFFRMKALPCFFGFFAGCMACHLLRTTAGFDAVPAAAAAGFGGTFLPLPRRLDPAGVHAAIYSGAFAGMCSANIIAAPAQVLLVSLAGSVISLSVAPLFQGIGGKLGAVAFAATGIVLLAKLFA